MRLEILIAALLFLFGIPGSAIGKPTVSVAAAANLIYALDALHAEFRRTAPDVTLSVTTSASGSLFAQIKNGAPFDVFLSADVEYPQKAAAAGLADAATLRTFATGRLVFWTMRDDLEVSDLPAALRHAQVRKIAIAQPDTAPYGRAAERTLKSLALWSDLQRKLVFGESITQTAQFVETGNADAGFVALSLVRSRRLAGRGRWQEVPRSLYDGVSLDHAGVLTRRGATNLAAQRYLEFLHSASARKILRDFGYATPE